MNIFFIKNSIGNRGESTTGYPPDGPPSLFTYAEKNMNVIILIFNIGIEG
jgi:hypothetical protein